MVEAGRGRSVLLSRPHKGSTSGLVGSEKTEVPDKVDRVLDVVEDDLGLGKARPIFENS